MNDTVQLPDITSDQNEWQTQTLQWVGMEGIASSVAIDGVGAAVAKANFFVSLDDAKAKGIHMSRLYRLAQQESAIEFSETSINQLLDQAIDSHIELSQNARLDLAFDLLLTRPSLKSGLNGQQTYAVALSSRRTASQYQHELSITIPYSSTCPCSAALSRQLMAQAVDEQFDTANINKQDLLSWLASEQGSIATPHSQRSYAYVTVTLGEQSWPKLETLVDGLERAIGTPVQTVVKRADEQDFARLNAENLMFCEDAARRLRHFLDGHDAFIDYQFKIEHQESLHAHNAVVIDRKFS